MRKHRILCLLLACMLVFTMGMAALAEETPVGRIGTPEDVADTAVFLAGDGARFITGQVIGVNGGFVV